MTTLFRKVSILLTVGAWFGFGSSAAIAQATERQNQSTTPAFTGMYVRHGVDGKPNTVRITDGKDYIAITEQEYRERGYSPPYEKLPVQIIQRIPVVPQHEN